MLAAFVAVRKYIRKRQTECAYKVVHSTVVLLARPGPPGETSDPHRKTRGGGDTPKARPLPHVLLNEI